MNKDSRLRYPRAKPIALAALELGSLQRNDDIKTACSGDEDLRDEVRWMLHAAESTAAKLLAQGPGDRAKPTLRVDINPLYKRLGAITTSGPRLAVLLSYVGWALARIGRTSDAVSALERAPCAAGDFAKAPPDFYRSTLNSLAAQYLELGRDADAQALLPSHRVQLQARGKTGSLGANVNLAQGLSVLASAPLHDGRTEQAARQFLSAHELPGPCEQQLAPAIYAASLVGLREAPSRAATRAAVADARWVPCSRRAIDFSKLAATGTARTAAPSLAEGRSRAMPSAAIAP